MKTIIAVISDTHIGSYTALCPPTYEVRTGRREETTVCQHSRLQAWVWGNWTDYWQYVSSLLEYKRNRKTNRLIVIHAGDVIDGRHHNTPQSIPDIDDQIRVALDVLLPIRDMADKFYGVYGTDAHAGQAGEYESRIYHELEADEYGPRLDLDIDDQLIEVLHHGNAARRDWSSNAANQAAKVMLDAASAGERAPDLLLCGHGHTIDDSGVKLPTIRCIDLPAWQLKTSFAWKVGASRRSDIGGLIINGGVLDFTKLRYQAAPDGRKVIHV